VSATDEHQGQRGIYSHEERGWKCLLQWSAHFHASLLSILFPSYACCLSYYIALPFCRRLVVVVVVNRH